MYLRQALQAQVQSVPSRLRVVQLSLKQVWQALALSERLLLPVLRMSVLLAFRALEQLARLRPVQRPLHQSRVLRVRAQLARYWRQALPLQVSAARRLRLVWVLKPLRAMRTFIRQALAPRAQLDRSPSQASVTLPLLASRVRAWWARSQLVQQLTHLLRGLLEQEKSLRYSSGDSLTRVKTRNGVEFQHHKRLRGRE